MLVMQSEYIFEDESRVFREMLEFFHPGQSDKQDALMNRCVKLMARRQIPFGASLNNKETHNLRKSWMNQGEHNEKKAALL